MITVDEVKQYLRVPYEDDDALINELIVTGYGYLRDAVDDFDALYSENENFQQKADSWVKLHWTPIGYEQREGGNVNAGDGLNFVARSVITQLQTYRYKGVK